MRLLLRFLALALALLVAAPAGALARTQYYCRMMEQVVSSCCCKSHTKGAQVEAASELRQPGCCEVVTSSHDAATATRDAATEVMPAALLALLPATEGAEAFTSAAFHAARKARGPPPLGPPLYAKHCTLLI